MATLAMSVSEVSNLLTMLESGNTKGGSITVPLTSCLTGLDQSVLQIKTQMVNYHTADSKPVKQEANGTVIHPPLVFPGDSNDKRTSLVKHSVIYHQEMFERRRLWG